MSIDYTVPGPAAPAFDAPPGTWCLRLSDEFVFINTSGGPSGWFDIGFNIDIADSTGDIIGSRVSPPDNTFDDTQDFVPGDMLIVTGTTPDELYVCLENPTNAAIWRKISGLLAALDTVDTAEINADAVTNAKLADMPQDTIKGRISAGAGDPENLTGDQISTIIGLKQHVFAYDTTTQAITGAGFQNILFDTNAVLSGWSHSVGPATAEFTCNKTGLYEVIVTGSVEKSGGGGLTAAIRALFNGVEVAGSQFGMDVTANNTTFVMTRNFFVDAVDTQDLIIQFASNSLNVSLLPGPNPGPATITPSITITIKRVA